MIGTIIDGRYKVHDVLGQGSFGVVYVCTEIGPLERLVALKMLHSATAGEKERSEFIRSSQILASLSHPNVVQIYSAGYHDDNPYIVMELVQGASLDALIPDHPPIRRVLEIMRQVAAGLAAIHECGIVHRDLKPAHVLVRGNGGIKIIDFGLSKMLEGGSSRGKSGYVVGTLSYMSPEQINGQAFEYGSEVFAFGIMLYEALTGVHPFHAEHDMSLLYNIAQRAHEPLSRHLPDCPEALVALVDRCLAKAATDRPGSMGELEQALRDILTIPDLLGTVPVEQPRALTSRSGPRNPYLNRAMIRDSDAFFGRSQEIRRIYGMLNATSPGSISIVGDRRIGKSSLLNYVYMPAHRQEFLDQPAKTIMVFIDLHLEGNMTVESFVQKLIGIARLELRGRLDLGDCTPDLPGIRKLVTTLEERGFRLAILFDEFEAITKNPNFDLAFFSFLRSLANHNVAYVTSSARDLQVLCHTREISHSPFFNIFSTVRLSVLRAEEAESLIRIPSARVGRSLDPYVPEILDMTGRFPFLIQIACSHAVEYLEELDEKAKPDFGEVRRRFYEEARLHYRYVWNDEFDFLKKSTLLRVAKKKNVPEALKHVLEELEERHYVERDGGEARLFASTFAQFVLKEEARESKNSLFERWFGRKKLAAARD